MVRIVRACDGVTETIQARLPEEDVAKVLGRSRARQVRMYGLGRGGGRLSRPWRVGSVLGGAVVGAREHMDESRDGEPPRGEVDDEEHQLGWF